MGLSSTIRSFTLPILKNTILKYKTTDISVLKALFLVAQLLNLVVEKYD